MTLPLHQVVEAEASAARGWPALETVENGPWTLRFASGYTKRANSVQALGDPWPADGDQRVRAAEEAYLVRGLAPTFKVPGHPAWAPLDQALEHRGYRLITPSQVLTLDLEGFSQANNSGAPPAGVVETGFTPRWLEGLFAANAVPADQLDAARSMARAVEGPLVASVPEGERDLAWAYVALVAPRAWLFDLVVAPEARGRGWGRAVVTSLAHRAHRAGATSLWLQVLEANTVARSLYETLGFVEAYRYHYRQLPKD